MSQKIPRAGEVPFLVHEVKWSEVKSLSRVRLFVSSWVEEPLCSSRQDYWWIFQARVLEWVAISFSRGSSQPRNQIQVSHIVGRHFTIWATREVYRLPFFPMSSHGRRVKWSLWSLFIRTLTPLVREQPSLSNIS